MSEKKYFLPYQERWLKDKSRLKIWEKSRRIGATYVQAYEDVRDAATDRGMDVWFSSADISAAREYILYCAQWARLLNIAAKDLGEIVLNSDKDIKALAIELSNGKRIHGLSSNPRAFRSKGGKVVLDEFAFHEDQDALLKSAKPAVSWGYPLRILSTYNGKGNLFYRLVKQSKDPAARSKWSVHTTPITSAVAEGLADKIHNRKLTDAERAEWIAEQRAGMANDDAFNEEYMCIPADGASAWLPWDLIQACESENAGKPEKYENNGCYVGMDIGRRRDLTVIWVIEMDRTKALWTREVVKLKGASFLHQKEEFARIMSSYKVVRACIDQTGMGEAVVEDLKRRFGKYKVEGVLFTNSLKLDLANGIKMAFETGLCRIPSGDTDIRNSHNSVKRILTSAGNPRFDADRNEAGHADAFWAHALAIHAAGVGGKAVCHGYQGIPNEVDTMLVGFDPHGGTGTFH